MPSSAEGVADGDIQWRWHAWPALDPDTLYGLMKLRSDIFVVEQACIFSDMDGLDPQCDHLTGRDARGRVVAGLRLVPPGVKAGEPSLGRVVVHPALRGSGAGRRLMTLGIDACTRRWPSLGIHIGAQQRLQAFYASLGFEQTGEMYLEDGIPHIDMRRAAPGDVQPAFS